MTIGSTFDFAADNSSKDEKKDFFRGKTSDYREVKRSGRGSYLVAGEHFHSRWRWRKEVLGRSGRTKSKAGKREARVRFLREKSRSDVKQRDQETWEKGKVRSKRDDVRGAVPPPWRGSGRCSSAWRMLSDEESEQGR
ncbi:hypothetical protein GW17_00048121 [Ensete ventricosum]|nr:hypothetical protein GW17_00048121 [Ensete ventricosum]RZS15178.1 hypothetical protein BHM03_00046983 [Ensete ventricosum]